jgi:hypothetical protein
VAAGNTYYYRVIAKNAQLTSGTSPTVSIATSTVPDAVTISSISNTYNSATVNWTAPYNGGLAITGYSYQLSTNGGATWGTAVNTNTTAVAVTVGGLSPVTTYTFRVRAINAVGAGAYGAQSSTTTPKAATAVNSASAEPLALPYGAMYGRSIPDSSPFYVSVTGLRRTDGTVLASKTGQIQFSVSGTWYNLGGATITTDASGNGSRSFWYLTGTGTPADTNLYTSGYNGQSAYGSNISTYGWPEDIVTSIYWRVVFPEDSQNFGVVSGTVELSNYYPGA